MRYTIAIVAVLTLSSCGGGRVSGEIASACMSAGRSAATPALCNCVQRAADQTLSNGDKSRVVGFFGDPEAAQETRMSSSRSADAFWDRYRAFTNAAEAMCRSG